MIETKRLLVLGYTDEVAKNNKPFLKVSVADTEKQTTVLYLWNSQDNFKELLQSSGPVMYIEGDFSAQFPEISSFKTAEGKEEEFIESYYPSTEKAGLILDKLMTFITEPEFIQLNKKIFQGEMRQRFIEYPAAEGYHHTKRGGLLKHTQEVMAFVSAIAKSQALNESLDLNILLEGALLHDIGKVEDYVKEGLIYRYSPYLSLQSHLSRGAEIVGKFAEPSAKILAVQHIIRSHHLQIEWNAVAKPATLEATLVFLGDYYSAALDRARNMQFAVDGIGRIKNVMMIDIEKAFEFMKPVTF